MIFNILYIDNFIKSFTCRTTNWPIYFEKSIIRKVVKISSFICHIIYEGKLKKRIILMTAGLEKNYCVFTIYISV